jgi:hypothetical protein
VGELLDFGGKLKHTFLIHRRAPQLSFFEVVAQMRSMVSERLSPG